MEQDSGQLSFSFPSSTYYLAKGYFIRSMEKTTKATITRPRLARILNSAGYEARPVRSVWNLDRIEWEFTLDATSAKIVADYYAQIGKVPPAAVRKYIQNQEGEA